MIPDALLREIYRHAESQYPVEGCGMLTGEEIVDTDTWRFIPCRNIQDQMHQCFPSEFLRTAREAYFIAPEDLFGIQKENRQKGRKICIIYHSHVDTEAYFSKEDTRMALSEGEPLYPGVFYLVVSVIKGKACGHTLYHWDSADKVFKG
ncbi:MAG: M67 family metallopeptidase [Candidatus Omnitrophica bacterium]|nr:M67 family metallopeptidase [Candidatus Omnitrophota bacterium]